MKDKNNSIILYCLGGIVVVWFALMIAPYIDGGIIEVINEFSKRANTPFNIEFCANSIKTVFILLVIYVLGIGLYISSKKNYRRGKEYGSALWGNAKQINKKYKQFPNNQNKILTQNVSIGLKAKKNRRNLNILVIGRKSVQVRRDFLASLI